MPTCTHLQVVPCQEKQIIKKFVRDVPCPQMKPKKKVPCPAGDRKRASRQVEEVLCTAAKRVQQQMTCPMKQQEKVVKCEREPKTCPAKERESSLRSCPKCENNRIQKLECEVYQLRKEIEYMKYERKEAEKAMQKAIIRSARALGGKCKSTLPGSIEKLLDSCTSDESSLSASTITFCGTKTMSPPIRPCQNKKKKEEFDCCASCAH
ncbi:hypothetical protein WH47_06060 [Habropoda laboriosa]|uniref:Uncharacterized protein n=1 Tax=Habropoda laboriosa TaxID=597456 RepID=A0A0L7QTG3_9HYME|nr:PREDICTED: uncharacterized protein LOC108575457 [Habropoda laboriosa]KOC61933.1 hypothetical protein WH47_06060 [Habropoda laboriosa]